MAKKKKDKPIKDKFIQIEIDSTVITIQNKETTTIRDETNFNSRTGVNKEFHSSLIIENSKFRWFKIREKDNSRYASAYGDRGFEFGKDELHKFFVLRDMLNTIANVLEEKGITKP